MSRDWRLEHLETQPYLRGLSVERKPYKAPCRGWDHDHCAACWTKFAAPGTQGRDILHEGYTTTADFVRGAGYEWVCGPCFESFAADMGWTDATARAA